MVATGQQETRNHFEGGNCRGRRETRNLNRKRSEEPTVLVPGTAALGLPSGLPCREHRAYAVFSKRGLLKLPLGL